MAAPKDGDKGTFKLWHGDPKKQGDTLVGSEREVKGTVRKFTQDGETRWEIVTDDPHYPAVGFLPENVLD